MKRMLAAILVLVASCVAYAGPITQVLPMRGAYWDASAPGTGWQIEVGREGFIFATGYFYTATGAPTWVTLSGQFQPATMTEYLASGGTIGRLNGDLYSAVGGQCIGCAFTPSTATLVGAGASLVFTSSRTAEFRYASQVVSLTRAVEIEPRSTLEALLSGSWRMKKYGPRSTVAPFNEITVTDIGGGEYRIKKRRPERRIFFAERIGAQPIADFRVPVPDDTGEQYEFSCNTFSLENACTYQPFRSPYTRNPSYGGQTDLGTWMANPVIYVDGNVLRAVVACFTNVNVTPTTPCEVQDGAVLRRRILQRVDFIPQGSGETMLVRSIQATFPSMELRVVDEFVMERVGD